MLCFLSEVQGVDGLREVGQCLCHGTDDGSLGVATECWLQDPCHLTVTVVDERLTVALGQLVDHIRQGKQTPIDVGTLSKPEPISLGLRDSLTTGQIHQVELRELYLLIARLYVDPEHSMRSGGCLIELVVRHDSQLVSLRHIAHDLLCIGYRLLSELVDVDTLDALSDIQILVSWIDQVIDTLIIDLHVADTDLVLATLVVVYEVKDLLDTERYESEVGSV